MKEKKLLGKNAERVLKILDGIEPNMEIGDMSLIIDVYEFKRNRSVHVYYSIYNSKDKNVFLVER